MSDLATAIVMAYKPRKPECGRCGAAIEGGIFYTVTTLHTVMLGVSGDYVPPSVTICGAECLKAWAESRGKAL